MRLYELPAVVVGSGGGAGGGIGGNGAAHAAISIVSTFGGLYYAVGACAHLVRIARHTVRRDIVKIRRELNDIEGEYRIRHTREVREAELPDY